MTEKADAFRALHKPGDPFILANAWDVGSARMLCAMGARAIGTSSAAHAFTLGLPDLGRLSRDEALAHAEAIVAAVPVPVSGDFENGFGESPSAVAETVRLAAEVGLAGISIEDTDLPGTDSYAASLAEERIRAAVSAARALPHDFVVVARADGMMHGSYDLPEAMERLRRFDLAGADCLYAPAPPDARALARICAATRKPVNALAAGPFARLTRAQMARMGVARISLGSSLARLTHRVIHDTAVAMFEKGDFSQLARGMSGQDVDRLLDLGSDHGEGHEEGNNDEGRDGTSPERTS